MDNQTRSCGHCGNTFRYRVINHGFNDSAYAYCNRCSFTVVLSGRNPIAQRVGLEIQQRIPRRDIGSPAYRARAYSTPNIEDLLKPCPCGGAFLASADPKCPHCARPLSEPAPSGIYSIVLNDNRVHDWWDEQAVDRLCPKKD